MSGEFVKMEGLEVTDYVMFSTLLVMAAICCILSFGSTKNYFIFNALFFVTQGISMILVPRFTLRYLDDKFEDPAHVDGLHLHLLFVLACAYIYIGVLFGLFRNTLDVTVYTSILWATLTSNVLIGLFAIHHFKYGQSHAQTKEKWTRVDYGFCIHCFLMVAELIFGSCIQLSKFRKWGGHPERINRLNIHARIDYLITFAIGLAFMAFPETLLMSDKTPKPLDNVHRYIALIIGVWLVTSAMITDRSATFIREMPKVILLGLRVIAGIALFGNAIYIQYMSLGGLRAVNPIAFVISPIWIGNAIMGYTFSRYGQLH